MGYEEDEFPPDFCYRCGTVHPSGKHVKGYIWLPKTRAYRSISELTPEEHKTMGWRCPYCGTTAEKRQHTDACPLGAMEADLAAANARIAELEAARRYDREAILEHTGAVDIVRRKFLAAASLLSPAEDDTPANYMPPGWDDPLNAHLWETACELVMNAAADLAAARAEIEGLTYARNDFEGKYRREQQISAKYRDKAAGERERAEKAERRAISSACQTCRAWLSRNPDAAAHPAGPPETKRENRCRFCHELAEDCECSRGGGRHA